MLKRTVSGIILALLLLNMLTRVFDIRPAETDTGEVERARSIQSNKGDFQVRSFTTEDVVALALQYWDAKDAMIMVAIAVPESGLDPNAGGDYGISDFNCSGYASWGLWQIYMEMHLDKLAKLGAPTADPCETARWLSDPNNNVRAAYEVWQEAYKAWGNGFLPWSSYKNGEYKKYLDMFERRISIFKSPANVTITDDHGRIISESENQIPGASFEYFEMTASKVFYLPSNLTYAVQLCGTAYGNCTIEQLIPTGYVCEAAFSQASFSLTSRTLALFDLLPFNANYSLKVDENGDGIIDYELIPETETLTAEYDVGVTEVIASVTVAGQGYSLPINVTIVNYGACTETFNVTVYANGTFIARQNLTLASRNSTVFTCTWNTTGFDSGKYTMSAQADVVPGETDSTDNTRDGGSVIVTIPGDLNGDSNVTLSDLVLLARAYGSNPADSNWNANADIDGNLIIGLSDLVILAEDYV